MSQAIADIKHFFFKKLKDRSSAFSQNLKHLKNQLKLKISSVA